ncbi:MAG: broad specificity phosphatase PhoE [Shewanella sp.]|jgi:broad specificity phosphatase PhoE
MAKKLLLLILLYFFITAPIQASEPEGTNANSNTKIVILVRHAEKQADQGKDPSLTPAGQRRAIQLKLALKDMPLTALYATPFKRTKETLNPISENREITIKVIDVKGGISMHVNKVLKAIRAENGNVLVVGHSNTIPLIIKAFGGPKVDDIAEKDYNNIYLLSLPAEGNAGLIHTRYGQ